MSQMSEDYSLPQRQSMLQVARDSIQAELAGHNEALDLKFFTAALLEKKASFVTLNINKNLRGCIGTLTAQRPLIVDVFQNARAAAFKDPRFKPLSLQEFQQIDIHISVLTDAKPYAVNSRKELLETIQVGKDGLILRENGKSATFLPSVWEKIPSAEDFVMHLRNKAGLDPKGWSPDTQVFYYRTIEFA